VQLIATTALARDAPVARSTCHAGSPVPAISIPPTRATLLVAAFGQQISLRQRPKLAEMCPPLEGLKSTHGGHSRISASGRLTFLPMSFASAWSSHMSLAALLLGRDTAALRGFHFRSTSQPSVSRTCDAQVHAVRINAAFADALEGVRSAPAAWR